MKPPHYWVWGLFGHAGNTWERGKFIVHRLSCPGPTYTLPEYPLIIKSLVNSWWNYPFGLIVWRYWFLPVLVYLRHTKEILRYFPTFGHSSPNVLVSALTPQCRLPWHCSSTFDRALDERQPTEEWKSHHFCEEFQIVMTINSYAVSSTIFIFILLIYLAILFIGAPMPAACLSSRS